MNEYYLFHHGIKGQRWGVRRYQNLDGTLTEAGKAHYGMYSDGSMSERGKKRLSRALYQQKRKENYKAFEKDIGKIGRNLSGFFFGPIGTAVYSKIKISQFNKEIEQGIREVPQWMMDINIDDLLKKAGV